MSNSAISHTDRIIKHLRRAETALNNLEAMNPDIKVIEFIEYIHNKRLELAKRVKDESEIGH